MIGQFLITFREVLEAALITAIILAYLVRTDRRHLSRYVWYGVSIAVMVSLVLGASMWLLYGGLSGASKPLFEGVAALIAVFVLTSMLIWMATKGKEIKGEVEVKIGAVAKRGAMIALVSLAFVVVFREGLETVLFLTPFLVTDLAGTLAGAFIGTLSGFMLAFAIFKVGMRIDLRRFFYFTSILLVLLAAGLLGYGLHELTEYVVASGGDPGWWGQYAYALDISKDSVFHHKGAVGSIFAVMFGYTVKPEWIRVIGHLLYLVTVLPLVTLAYRKPEIIERLSRSLRRAYRTLVRRPFGDSPDAQREPQRTEKVERGGT
jgi:high-affinity iron transporter